MARMWKGSYFNYRKFIVAFLDSNTTISIKIFKCVYFCPNNAICRHLSHKHTNVYNNAYFKMFIGFHVC